MNEDLSINIPRLKTGEEIINEAQAVGYADKYYERLLEMFIEYEKNYGVNTIWKGIVEILRGKKPTFVFSIEKK